MENRLTILKRTGCLVMFIFLIPGVILAQIKSFEEQRQQQLNKLDLRGLGNTFLFNNGVISEFEVNYFKALSKPNQVPKVEKVTPEE